MRLKPMRIISASFNAEIIYQFLMYDYCERRTTCPPSLLVSVSDYKTGGLGSIPGLVHKSQCFSIYSHLHFYAEFYCNNLDLLPPKPKFTFKHLKKGIQEFHRRFVLAPADKAANNVVVA